MKLMSDKQKSQLLTAVCEVQFLEKNIKDIEFEDPLLNIVWQGVIHSVDTSLKGYISREKSLGRVVSVPLEGGSKNNFNPSEQVQVQVQVQVQEEVQEQKSQIVEISTTLQSGIKVSEYLLSKILVNKPNFRKPNLQTWAKDIDLAIRIDKRTEQQLKGCIDWIYSDGGSFWIPNILSAKKLREKFDTMESQMMRTKNKTTTMVDKIYDAGMTAQDMVKEMERRA
ncbi:MAG: hypothetical protein E3J43_09940 [Candidatus Heimdallarchaeota archaeon]|nr:MAG: hypothetical protein E3J43_09940 [Candidatus Heimdallarchaeota archaeon]